MPEITNMTTDSASNISNSTEALIPMGIAVTGALGMSTIIGIGIFGNILLLAALYRTPSLRKKCNVFLATLAINDLLTLLGPCLVVLISYIRRSWVLGGSLCVLFIPIVTANITTTSLHIVMITTYRFLIVVKPNWYRHWSKKWVMALIVFLLFMFGFSIDLLRRIPMAFFNPVMGIHAEFDSLFMWCDIKRDEPMTVEFILIWYICLILIITALYLKIYLFVKKNQVRVTSNTNSSQNSKKSKDVQVAKTMLVVMVIFAVTYLPWPLANNIARGGQHVNDFVALLFTLLQWSSASVNWLVYGAMNSQFKQAYRSLLCPRRVLDMRSGSSVTESRATALTRLNSSTATRVITVSHVEAGARQSTSNAITPAGDSGQ